MLHNQPYKVCKSTLVFIYSNRDIKHLVLYIGRTKYEDYKMAAYVEVSIVDTSVYRLIYQIVSFMSHKVGWF